MLSVCCYISSCLSSPSTATLPSPSTASSPSPVADLHCLFAQLVRVVASLLNWFVWWQARKVLELCRPAVRWATQCKLQNAQKELSEAMMSGDAVIVRQAQESYTRKMDESQHDGLVGSSVDLDEFQLKIGQLEGLQKRELDRHNAWKNSTELATILEAQAELSERIRGLVGQGEDPEVIGLERFAEQLRIEQKEGKSCGTTGRICKSKGTCKWLKIKLQVSAATKQKQVTEPASLCLSLCSLWLSFFTYPFSLCLSFCSHSA